MRARRRVGTRSRCGLDGIPEGEVAERPAGRDHGALPPARQQTGDRVVAVAEPEGHDRLAPVHPDHRDHGQQAPARTYWANVAPSDPGPVLGGRGGPQVSADPLTQLVVGREPGELAGQHVVGVRQQPVDAVGHEVVSAGAPHREHGHPCGSRLEGGDAERLEVCGREVGVGAVVQPAQVAPGRPAPGARPRPCPSTAGGSPYGGAAVPRPRWSPSAGSPGRGGRGPGPGRARVASGRLRETRRIAETTWTGLSRMPGEVVGASADAGLVDGAPADGPSVGETRHHAASTPLGTTSTWAPRATALTRAAAIVDTALSATPAAAHRATCPIALNSGAARSNTQWKVAVTGVPRPRATGTSSVAKGLTMPRCA